MKTVVTTMTINASTKKVWELISKGSDLEKWFPVIASCKITGTGAGAKRVCTTIQGNVLKETILTVDNKAMIFQYTIDEQDMMPTTDVIGTLHVTPAENGKSNVTWLANYNLLDENMAPMIAENLDILYQSGISSIEKYINEN